MVCLDEPGAGGACHCYRVESADPDTPIAIFGSVNFQEGPVKENGVIGLHQEDLLYIVYRTAERVARGVEGTSTEQVIGCDVDGDTP